MKKLELLLLLCIWAGIAHAQVDADEKPRDFGANKLVITGHAEITGTFDSTTSNFGDAGFSVIFLNKLSDKLFAESELEIATDEGEVEVGLEHANLVWLANKYVAFHVGRFVPHFGLYRGRLGEGFINRFPGDPAGFGDGGIGPMEQMGIGAMGGIPLGVMKMNYDVWVSNGIQLLHSSAEDVGQFEYEAYLDNNKNKAIGGRIGLLPFSNSSLELGFSYENDAKTGDMGTPEEGVGANMMAIDGNFYHQINQIKSTVRISGEFKKQDVTKYTYQIDSAESYTFDNSLTAWYATISLRPSGASGNFLRNLEIAYRYSQFNLPSDAPWGGDAITRTVIALDYWLKWNCVAKLALQNETGMGSQFLAQVYYGF